MKQGEVTGRGVLLGEQDNGLRQKQIDGKLLLLAQKIPSAGLLVTVFRSKKRSEYQSIRSDGNAIIVRSCKDPSWQADDSTGREGAAPRDENEN